MRTVLSNGNSSNRRRRLVVYAIGRAFGRPGPGAYAFCYRDGGKLKMISGKLRNTTRDEAEVAALECVVRKLPPNRSLIIFTDSVYIVRGMNKWISGWIQREWMTISGTPVQNADLWRSISNHCRKRTALIDLRLAPDAASNPIAGKLDRLIRRKAAEAKRDSDVCSDQRRRAVSK
jgi:ribonuclease HI